MNYVYLIVTKDLCPIHAFRDFEDAKEFIKDVRSNFLRILTMHLD